MTVENWPVKQKPRIVVIVHNVDVICNMQEAAHHVAAVSRLVSTSVLVNWLPYQTGI